MTFAKDLTTDFHVLDSRRPFEQLEHVLQGLRTQFVLVHARDPVTMRASTSDSWFLFERVDLLELLQQQVPGDDLSLVVAKWQKPVETVHWQALSRAPKRPVYEPRVVLDDNGPVAILRKPPEESRSTRGAKSAQPAFRDMSDPGAGAGTSSLLKRMLNARTASSVALHARCDLHVSLAEVGETLVGGSAVELSAGSTIDITIEPLLGVALLGTDSGQLVVSEPQEPQELKFELRATAVGEARLVVLAYCDHRRIAKLYLTLAVTDSEQANSTSKVDACSVRIEAARRSKPDLSLHIFEDRSLLMYRLFSADGRFHNQKFGPQDIRVDALMYFRGLFKEIENLPVATPQQQQIAALKLGAIGSKLFKEVLPEELQRKLWELRDRITVEITSEEPWIPWELCRLSGPEGQVGPYFGEAFAVTRWLAGVGSPMGISLRNMALIVPTRSGLPAADDERKFVLGLADGTRQVTQIPADFVSIVSAMQSGTYDAWHFTGHARASLQADADQARLELDDVPFTPTDLQGQAAAVLKTRPFVFFNACQSAQAGFGLTGLGGWARRFIQPGGTLPSASAFIGTYWAVSDRSAHAFAEAVYGALLGGSTLGEAVRAARLSIRGDGDPTWLAYTVYADPFAKLESSSSAPSP